MECRRPASLFLLHCLLAVVGACCGAVVATASAQAPVPAAFEPPASWLTAIEPFALAENLYYVGSAELGAYLFTSPDGHVLIDAPMVEFGSQLLDNIRRLGFDVEDVSLILATHGHFDHTGAVAEVVAATGAELVLAPHAAALIGAGGRGDFFLGDAAGYPPAGAARLLGPGEVVTVGPIRLTAEFTPGHTRGCTSWRTMVRIGGREHEAVLVCSLSVLDGYQLVGEQTSYPGIAADFCRSVARLEQLQPTVFLANHGSFMRLEAKREALGAGEAEAFVDPELYRSYLQRARARIEATLEEQGGTDCAAVLARNASTRTEAPRGEE